VVIPLSTVKIMSNEYQSQIATKEALGVGIKEDGSEKNGDVVKPDDLIFCHMERSPIPPDGVTQAFQRLSIQSELKNIRLHDSRHSFASLMLKQNVHPSTLAQMLGHSRVQRTLDVYSHILPGLQEATANKFDDILTERKGLLPSNN
jgi:integrase